MEGYTKISVEVKYYDGQVSRVETFSNAWDLDGEQLGNLFEQLMLAMGFHPDTVAGIFRGDEDVYAEAADLPCCEPCCDEAPCTGDTLANVFAALDDPCYGCSEACEDTACLHEDVGGPILGPQDWNLGDGDVE